MSAGPVRRFFALVGLGALTPTAYLVASGSLTPEDAAVRALATLGAVEIVARLTQGSLRRLADVLESEAPAADGEGEPTEVTT